jgi:CHAT domain-containing protein/tetratricopeptide (TPR) repeat protein
MNGPVFMSRPSVRNRRRWVASSVMLRRMRFNNFQARRDISALVLLACAASAHAGIQGYRGEMQNQTTVKGCTVEPHPQPVTLVLNEDPTPPHLRFDGYVLYGYPIVTLHVSGNDPNKLTVDQAIDAATPHTNFTLRLELNGARITGGRLERVADTAPAACASDLVRLRLSADTANARLWFEQANALFQIRIEELPVFRLAREYRFADALVLERRVLAHAEQAFGPDDPRVAPLLSTVALLMIESSQFAEAEPLARRALAADEKFYGANTYAAAADRERLAQLLGGLGQFGEAETQLRRAIAINEASFGVESPQLTPLLVDLARLLAYTGRHEEAETTAQRALHIDERTSGAKSTPVANDLAALVMVYTISHRYTEAESLGERLLAIDQSLSEDNKPKTMIDLALLGNVYHKAGEDAKAEPLLRRALALAEASGTPENYRVGAILATLGLVTHHLGKDTEALAQLRRAYRIAHTSKLSSLAWAAPARLMSYYDEIRPQRATLAILYGKEAVNQLEQLRRSLAASGNGAQDAFTNQTEVAAVYRELADLLVEEHRLGEAQQVLAMLKEQELYAFTANPTQSGAPATTATLTAHEVELGDLNESAVKLGQDIAALQAQFRENHQLTPEEHARLDALRAQMDQQQATFDARAEVVARSSSDPEAQRRRAQEINDYSRAFQGTLKTLGHHAVLAQYFILDDHVEILLTTPTVVLARQTSIKREDLNSAIRSFRKTLSQPNTDPLPQARVLYDVLLAPIAVDLRAAGASTLMLSLDDTLRYVPFAALHDGHRYLIESFSIALVNEAVRDKLSQSANSRWAIWGLGVTKAQPDFGALPYVAIELSDIAGGSGVLSGHVLLDQAFTEASLRDGLDQAYPIIHIASHFRFAPGSMNDSFLLLGDGSRMTLAQIKSRLNFNGVELLTLSACETALGDAHDPHHGEEIEGLGAIAQQGGAKAVLASLWPVADRSTALLMSALYRAHKEAQMDKADSLREAQLSLLRGSTSASATAGQEARGLTRIAALSSSDQAAQDSPGPYAHPFYWAPFILMGNWL